MSMLDKNQQPSHDFDGITENRVNKPPAYFSLLYYGLIVWGVVFMAYYLFSGWSSGGEFEEKMAAHQQQLAEQKPPQAALPAAVAAKPAAAAVDAARLYAENCAMCHGAQGEGGIGPALNTAGYNYGRDKDEVILSIAGGRPGGMPGFENRFSKAETEAVAEFVLLMK